MNLIGNLAACLCMVSRHRLSACMLPCAGCRSVTDGGAWLAYSTAEQVVGLIVWPLDGDPQHSMGVIAHPGEVKGLALSFDGRKLVTLGECEVAAARCAASCDRCCRIGLQAMQ